MGVPRPVRILRRPPHYPHGAPLENFRTVGMCAICSLVVLPLLRLLANFLLHLPGLARNLPLKSAVLWGLMPLLGPTTRLRPKLWPGSHIRMLLCFGPLFFSGPSFLASRGPLCAPMLLAPGGNTLDTLMSCVHRPSRPARLPIMTATSQAPVLK